MQKDSLGVTCATRNFVESEPFLTGSGSLALSAQRKTLGHCPPSEAWLGGGTRRGSAGSAGGVGSAAPTPSYGSSHVLCVPASRTRSTWRLFWRVPAPLAVHWGWALAPPPEVGHAAHGPEQLARPEPPVQQVPSPPQLSSPERWSRDASDCSLLTAPSYLCWGREAPSLPTTALRCPSVDDPSQLSPYLLTKKCLALPHSLPLLGAYLIFAFYLSTLSLTLPLLVHVSLS